MLPDWLIILISFSYLSLLFAIAYFADQRADSGRSITSNPYIYTLSIAVYCTAWTFYGSVGRATSTGVGFLPIYLGPTLMAALWWFVLRKIVRISKAQRITSIADFIASRYGKSTRIGGLVTIIAVVGIMPYISLQLKAVSTSFQVLLHFPADRFPQAHTGLPPWSDTALWVSLAMALFSILFGTRHIDATERHEGMVAAIAFESLVKLLAFSAVGIYITFFLFDGPGELFSWIPQYPELDKLLQLEALPGGYANWLSLTFLSMMAILFLPRQFQVLVVENVDEQHIKKAVWLFPLYLLAINIFVLPISFAGQMLFPGGSVDPDTFVLTLPLTEGQNFLALFAFLGGLSAATGMVIVATVALSTMICNDLVMPILLRTPALAHKELSGLLLAIRRGSIVVILFLSYIYVRLIGESYALVSIGLVSFAAAAQFAPAILAGIYWKGASRQGAIAGLMAGFIVWAYTLLLPAFAKTGWLPGSFLDQGPLAIQALRPYALFGLDMFDPITHAVFWSMFANIGLLVGVSLFTRQNTIEQIQATLFVDIFEQDIDQDDVFLQRGTAMVADLKGLVTRFIGRDRAEKAFTGYARTRDIELPADVQADANLIEFAERLLSGAIGAASARIMVSTVIQGEAEALSMDGVMKILDETSQVIEYSHRLEEKSRELEAATRKLRAANERLKELDRMKNEFVSTVSHELRTPLTSIRAFSEILQDNPDISPEEHGKFLGIIVKESERLTRLINRILDLAKLEANRVEWNPESTDLRGVVEEALLATSQLFQEKSVRLDKNLPPWPVPMLVDRDRIMQVVINLVSNAVHFCPPEKGRVVVRMYELRETVQVEVSDNGPGIPKAERKRIFEKFHQLKDRDDGKPKGTGLGLAICKGIVEHHQGRIWVRARPAGPGTAFIFSLPRPPEEQDDGSPISSPETVMPA